MRSRIAVLLCAGLAAAAAGVAAYPLDGYETTGIRRLLAIRLVQEGKLPGGKQPPGALLEPRRRRPAPRRRDASPCPRPTPTFTRQVVDILGADAESYGVAVLDLTDPASPRYAEHRGDYRQNVGSVGKLVVALSLFQALADAWPDDLAKRTTILRETVVTADDFSQSDHHTVRFFDPKTSDARAPDDPRSATGARSTSSSTGCSRRARTRRRGWSCARRC